MYQGPQQSTIWQHVFNLSHHFDASVVHQWLQDNLPFWDAHNVFDHLKFVAWYDQANFMDKEIVYKYLTPKEQAVVLKTWSTQIPALPIVKQLDQTRDCNTNFLDGPAPIRAAISKTSRKGVDTKKF